MANLTLLQIVQRTLSLIDSDNVTSVDDTTESEQVVLIVKTIYEDLMSEFPWYHKRSTVNLEVTTVANEMKIPTVVDQILSDVIYYNRKRIFFLQPNAMRDLLARRDTTASNVDSLGAINDTDPTYWSSYDDENIVFDSYDGTLASSLSELWAASEPASPSIDTDVPDLPHDLNSVLLWGVFEEAMRSLKGDEVAARTYGSKYKKAKARSKLWARKAGKKHDTNNKVNYSRRVAGSGRRSDISSSQVIG